MDELYQKINSYILKIQESLIIAEQQSRKKNNDALDVDDDELSLRMQTEALAEIKRFRKLRQYIDEIEEELNSFTNSKNIGSNIPGYEIPIDIYNDKQESDDIVHINNGPFSVEALDDVTTNERDEEEFYDDSNDYQDEETGSNVRIEFLHKDYTLESIREVLPKITELLMFRYPYEVSRFPWDKSLTVDGKQVFSYNKNNLLLSDCNRLSNKMQVVCMNSKKDILAISKIMLNTLGVKENSGLKFL